MIIPATIGAFVTPLYLFTDSYAMVAGAFIVQGAFLGAIYGQNPCYLSERFPIEVRATASGFCYHQGAIWAGFTGPVLTYFAAGQPLGFTVPMLIATAGAAVVFVVTLLFSPGDKGHGARSAAHLGGGARGVTRRPLVAGVIFRRGVGGLDPSRARTAGGFSAEDFDRLDARCRGCTLNPRPG
jgi:MFS family permease